MKYLSRWGIVAAACLALGTLSCSDSNEKEPAAAQQQQPRKISAEQAVAKLKEKGIIQSAEEARSQKGVDIMLKAIAQSKPAVLKLILAAGADANAKDENGKPLLAVAVEAGDFQCTKALMEAGANPETLPAESLVELVYPFYQNLNKRLISVYGDKAAKNAIGREELKEKHLKDRGKTVRLLLASGADLKKCGLDPHVKARFYNEERPLLYVIFYAIKDGEDTGWSRADRVKLLVKAGIDVNAKDPYGRPAAYYAASAYMGDEILKIMLDAGLDPNCSEEFSLLQSAVRYGSANMVKNLLEAGANARVVDEKTGDTLLTDMARGHSCTGMKYSDNGEKVRLLLLAGVDPHLKNKEGKTALQLLEEYFQKNPSDYAPTADRFGYEQSFKLLRAVDNPKELKKLLAKPMTKLPKPRHYGRFVTEGGKEKFVPSISAEKAKEILKYAANDLVYSLNRAASCKDRESIELLIAAGADVNARTYTYPLHELSQGEVSRECMRLLLAAGANPNVSQRDGTTPLHIASLYASDPEIVRMLIDAGADVNAADNKKERPLHKAVKKWELDPLHLRLLLDAGADVLAVNQERKTALQILEATGKEKKDYQQCLELLQAAEKK